MVWASFSMSWTNKVTVKDHNYTTIIRHYYAEKYKSIKLNLDGNLRLWKIGRTL